MGSPRTKETVAVISRLVAAGGWLWVEAGRLRYRGPAGLLTDEDERFFKAYRDQIMRVIDNGVLEDCLDRTGTSVVRPRYHREQQHSSELRRCRCNCGCPFSTANLTRTIVSEMIN